MCIKWGLKYLIISLANNELKAVGKDSAKKEGGK